MLEIDDSFEFSVKLYEKALKCVDDKETENNYVQRLLIKIDYICISIDKREQTGR